MAASRASRGSASSKPSIIGVLAERHPRSSSGAQRLDVDIEVTVDHADPDWRGNVGVVPKLIPKVAFDPHDAMALICGPEVMMRFS